MATVNTGRVPFCGLICPTTEVPPPKGMTIKSCSLASFSKVSTSLVDCGNATPSGKTPKSPLCIAIQSGKLWPRACLSLSSWSIETISRAVRAVGKRDSGTVLRASSRLAEVNFLVLPICDLISFAPCGETSLLIFTLPQPFQRVCSIGVLREVLLFELLSGRVVSVFWLSAISAVEADLVFLRKRNVILLIETYLSNDKKNS